jgi:hypothetical protein
VAKCATSGLEWPDGRYGGHHCGAVLRTTLDRLLRAIDAHRAVTAKFHDGMPTPDVDAALYAEAEAVRGEDE